MQMTAKQAWLTAAAISLAALTLAADTKPAADTKIDSRRDAAGKAWWEHVKFLADDKREGRNVGSKGFEAAADYVTTQFEQAGLAPGNGSSYSQPVDFVKVTLNEPASSIILERDSGTRTVKLGEEATLGAPLKVLDIEAPMVFVGYGLDIPEAKYSDLKDPAIKGAIAVYLSGGPSTIPGNLRSHYSSGEERGKAMRAAGAVGAISIANPKIMDIPWARQSANRLQARMSLADPVLGNSSALFGATWNATKSAALFEGSGHNIDEMIDLATADKPIPHFALKGKLKAHVVTATEKIPSRNVVGIRMGADPKLKNEFVILSAHLDHLGVGQPVNGDSIFNGAMDDASGVASVIEIARALKAGNVKTKRSIAFITVTGEEKGEQGSRFFAEHSTVKGTVVADINMDMFLPLFPLKYLEVQGLNESTLGDDIRAVAAPEGVIIQADKEPNANRFIRSDQYSFIKKGVPALAFKFGWIPGSPEEKIFKDWYRDRYHGVADDLTQPVDLAGAAEFNEILKALLQRVADAPLAPKWKDDSFFKRFATK
jgi:Zn-dependent M28 family amino/carboxypeptidase